MPPYFTEYGGVVMPEYTCKKCGETFNRRGKKPGVFCSLECKANWQRDQKPYGKEWLYQKYVTEGKSTYQIAEIVERNPKQVYEWLKGYGIPMRERKWDTKSGAQPFHDGEWLRREYIEKQRSAGEIAEQFGVTDGNVLFFLRRFKIERRDISEARSVKHWGASGEDNPMYGKRGEDVPNWKGGITPERQAFYSSLEWIEASKEVWARDKGICQRCGEKREEKRGMHIHHLVSFAVVELRADPDNLTMLCCDCHYWVHSLRNVDKEFIIDV
jgi:transposase-like protein